MGSRSETFAESTFRAIKCGQNAGKIQTRIASAIDAKDSELSLANRPTAARRAAPPLAPTPPVSC